MQDCLKVDSLSRPIEFCTWQDAVKLIYEGVAIVLRNDYSGEMIHSQHLNLPVPRVILIKDFVSKYKKETIALNRRNVVIRDERRCQYCEKIVPFEEQTLDHVFPRSRGGRSTWENLVLACGPCNREKADMTPEEAGMVLMRQPTRPKPGLQYKEIGRLRPEWADWTV